jgi:deoxyribose-phosphate aldolase
VKPKKKACEMTIAELAAYIDHSVLKPEFTQDEIKKHISEGIRYGCRTACINPASIPLAKRLCAGTATELCVVCDFPFGLSATESKVAQAESICKQGDIFELDIVANYGWIRSGLWSAVTEEIRQVATVCHTYGTALKTIFETDALTLDEIKQATECAIGAGSDFVKTSTGFFTGGKNDGATVEVVSAIMETAQGRCKVKGSGGIRTQETFFELIDLGIDRMGVGYSSTAKVVGEKQKHTVVRS